MNAEEIYSPLMDCSVDRALELLSERIRELEDRLAAEEREGR